MGGFRALGVPEDAVFSACGFWVQGFRSSGVQG